MALRLITDIGGELLAVNPDHVVIAGVNKNRTTRVHLAHGQGFRDFKHPIGDLAAILCGNLADENV